VRKDEGVIRRMEGNWVAVLFLRFLYVTMFWNLADLCGWGEMAPPRNSTGCPQGHAYDIKIIILPSQACTLQDPNQVPRD
jgi:hypothetical protein